MSASEVTGFLRRLFGRSPKGLKRPGEAEIAEGMSAEDVRRLLGDPTMRMTGAEFMRQFGTVVGNAAAKGHSGGMDHWLYRSPDVEYQIVLVGGHVTRVQKTLLGAFAESEGQRSPLPLAFRERIKLSSIWAAELGLRGVLLQGDPEEFFSSEMLPPLQPEMTSSSDPSGVPSNGHDQHFVRFSWYIAYLHHPVPAAVLRTMAAALNDSHDREAVLRGISLYLPELLTHANAEVREAAAKLLWECDDPSVKAAIVALSNTGAVPSGVDATRAKDAARLIGKHCPPTRQVFSESLVRERFGPETAGLGKPGSQAAVVFKGRETRQGPGSALSLQQERTPLLAKRVRLHSIRSIPGWLRSIGESGRDPTPCVSLLAEQGGRCP